MPTYAEYGRIRERDTNRRKADARDAQRHRGFDLSAQDNHMKYERSHFCVVTASASFREGWDRIFGART